MYKSSTKRGERYTPEEKIIIEMLATNHYKSSDYSVAKKLKNKIKGDRSLGSLTNQVYKFRKENPEKFPKKSRLFTSEDIKLIREYSIRYIELTDLEVGQKLMDLIEGRTLQGLIKQVARFRNLRNK
ncbi:hypothetical protein ACOI1C_20290 [Bacillus sp. DJP31]|uniref:hypothetical protein n=1 Tax=Bacillus sp. DJP31 TaxID=3409789 RepID=UPI003BB7E640